MYAFIVFTSSIATSLITSDIAIMYHLNHVVLFIECGLATLLDCNWCLFCFIVAMYIHACMHKYGSSYKCIP